MKVVIHDDAAVGKRERKLFHGDHCTKSVLDCQGELFEASSQLLQYEAVVEDAPGLGHTEYKTCLIHRNRLLKPPKPKQRDDFVDHQGFQYFLNVPVYSGGGAVDVVLITLQIPVINRKCLLSAFQ